MLTKEKVKASVEVFLENSEYCSVKSERDKYFSLLNKLSEQYQEDLSLTENIKRRINMNSKQVFESDKSRLKHWLEYSHFKADMNSIQFCFQYFNFDELHQKIENPKPYALWTKRDRNYYTLSKLFAYLCWIGVPSNKILDIKKGDYNPELKILLVDDKEYDLKNDVYKDCANTIHQELYNNLTNIRFVKNENNIYEYVSSPTYNYDENDMMFETISGEVPKTLREQCLALLKRMFFRHTLITKNGVFERLYNRIGNKTVTREEFKQLLSMPEINNPISYSNALLQEFTLWKNEMMKK